MYETVSHTRIYVYMYVSICIYMYVNAYNISFLVGA